MPKNEGILVKLLPVLLVGFTTAIAVCLVAIRHLRITNGFYTLATKDPDTVGLVVQIVASTFGACQVYAITTLVNYAVRLRLQHGNSIDLKLLRFWTSITNASAQAIRSSLPAGLLFTFAIVFILLRIPAALWAGALTPVSTTTNITTGSILVPTYPAEDVSLWQGSFRKYLNSTVDMSLICHWETIDAPSISGSTSVANVVSNCPAVDRSSALIGGLATASQKAPRTHARVDNAGWNYKGRSYGVGATAGLVSYQNVKNTSAPVQDWTYHEYGYDTTVECHKNESSTYYIYELEYYTESLRTNKYSATKTYEITGTLPNSLPGVVEDYTLSTKTGTDDATNVFGWSTLSNAGGNMMAVAGTGNHRSFDKTVCSVTFTPSLFSVTVNVTDSSIAVTKLNTSASDIEPTGAFRRAVFYNLEQMSRMSSLTIASSLGQQLTLNYNAIRRNGTDNDTLAAGIVQDGIMSLLDDLFVAHAQSQLVIAKHTTPAPIEIHSKAVSIGSAKFLWAVLAWNLVVFTFILIESVRTKFWKDMSVFDFSDVPDMAIAASMGGESVARACRVAGKSGEKRDEVLDLVRVRLRREKGGFALVGAEDWEGEEFELGDGRGKGRGRMKEGQSLVRQSAAQQEEV